MSAGGETRGDPNTSGGGDTSGALGDDPMSYAKWLWMAEAMVERCEGVAESANMPTSKNTSREGTPTRELIDPSSRPVNISPVPTSKKRFNESKCAPGI